jgi:hypothetical protein
MHGAITPTPDSIQNKIDFPTLLMSRIEDRNGLAMADEPIIPKNKPDDLPDS